MKKKLTVYLLTAALTVSAGTMGWTENTFASDDEVITLTDTVTEDGMVITTGDESLFEAAESGEEENLVGDSSLPSRYRPDEDGSVPLTAVQNQKSLNLCWAYSALDAGQIGQLKQGAASSTELLYSAGHLGYSTYNGTGDHFSSSNSWYGTGGNFQLATGTLLSWYGAASESQFPTASSLTVSESDQSSSLAHLTGFERLSYNFAQTSGASPLSEAWAAGIKEVKQAVLENGAAAIDYAAQYPVSSTDCEEVRAAGGAIVYHSTQTTQTHQGVIVGWDDSVVTGAVSSTGEALTGAFLLKNTWGTDTGWSRTSYNEPAGYRWLSYYDMSMTNPVVYHFEDRADGTHDDSVLFSYDATGYYKITRSSSVRRGANVFLPDQPVTLDAVGVYLPVNGSYQIQIETNLKDGVPGTGDVITEKEGAEDHFGFYTIAVPEVTLQKHQAFAVIVTAKSSQDGMYYVFSEGNSESTSATFRRVTTAAAGESYLYGAGGAMSWKDNVSSDLSSGSYYNNCIKAYGNPASSARMQRLYNPNSGEHFYTASVAEHDSLVSIGWRDEGIGWTAPTASDTPVYRLYNPNTGDHHYTTSAAERQMLIRIGWRDEGIGWYSDDAKTTPLYRAFNPNEKVGTHNYTKSDREQSYLVSIGWRDEGIGWYGL